MPDAVPARAVAVRRHTVLPVIFALATAASACDIVTADFKSKESAEWRRTYQLAPGGRVEVININGKIDVTPSSDNTVDVIAVKTARAATAEAAKASLERIEILEAAGPASVRIETKVARANGFLQGGGTDVRYTVRVPASAEVRFRTVNGGIELARLTGRVSAETTNGGIQARQVGGSIDASTTNGGVDVELTHVTSPGVKLECTNGGIKLRLPGDARATLSASITNGGIAMTTIDGMTVDTRESTRRRLEAQLNGGGPTIRLAGTNGGIEIAASRSR